MADMHPEDIKAAIRKRGWTLKELAEANGMAKQNIALAIRQRVSEPAEEVIASFLDMDPREIWPSRFRDDGKRIRLRGVPTPGSRNRRKAETAA